MGQNFEKRIAHRNAYGSFSASGRIARKEILQW
jgi:hypothetical protein